MARLADLPARRAVTPRHDAAFDGIEVTYFRKQEKMYIESLAEDATTTNRAEWLVNGTWYTANRVPTGATLKHWRLRGLNTVLLFDHARGVNVGTTFTAKVPVEPFSVFTGAQKTCADDDDHISLDQSVYWYRWQPDQTSCKIALQDLKVTVSKKFSSVTSTVYPEYDQLTADKKVTMVVLFGQIDDGALTEYETGMRNFKRFGGSLAQAGFTKAGTAPLGQRRSDGERKRVRGARDREAHLRHPAQRPQLVAQHPAHVRNSVGDSTFGVSGVRENTFKPR